MAKIWHDARHSGCGREPPLARAARSPLGQFGSVSGRFDTAAKGSSAPKQGPRPPGASPITHGPLPPPVPRIFVGHPDPVTVCEEAVPREFRFTAAYRFSGTQDYGRWVVGGWGNTGRVRVGVPFVDQFREVVVVFRNPDKGGNLDSVSIGNVPISAAPRKSIVDP